MNGIGGADSCDRTFVAVHAQFMTNLKVQRPVTEHGATFDAFGAPDTKRFIDRIFVVGIFDKSPENCAGGAELIFCGGIQFIGLRFKVTGA